MWEFPPLGGKYPSSRLRGTPAGHGRPAELAPGNSAPKRIEREHRSRAEFP
jgi:hypothetical protein